MAAAPAARAQEAAGAQQPAADEEPTTLAGLTVTAQKREEALQDVPISVTAISEQLLQDTGVRDIKDLQVLVPGLTVTSTQSEAITTARIRGTVTSTDVHGFIAPRAELLLRGRLVDFEEWETDSRTEIAGALAQRRLRYAKHGTLDGVPFEGTGTKMLQLARTTQGWKIAALQWTDDPA